MSWNGLVFIKEMTIKDKDGRILLKKENLKNIFHSEGESLILSSVFTEAGRAAAPTSYYFGLDNRATLARGDTMGDLTGEPTGNGYARQALEADFNIAVVSSTYRAEPNAVTFSASGGGWGAVTNLFLTDKSDNTGSLIASINVGSFSLTAGQSTDLRMFLALSDSSLV